MKFAVMRISYCLFAIFCASLFAHALIHVIADASKSIQAGQSADIFGFEHFGQIVSDYGRWLIGVAQGNIGTMPGGQEISGLLLSAGMQTARIYLFVLILLGLIIGPLGYFSGKNRHGRLDRAAQYFTDALNSVPIMVVGILLLIPLFFKTNSEISNLGSLIRFYSFADTARGPIFLWHARYIPKNGKPAGFKNAQTAVSGRFLYFADRCDVPNVPCRIDDI